MTKHQQWRLDPPRWLSVTFRSQPWESKSFCWSHQSFFYSTGLFTEPIFFCCSVNPKYLYLFSVLLMFTLYNFLSLFLSSTSCSFVNPWMDPNTGIFRLISSLRSFSFFSGCHLGCMLSCFSRVQLFATLWAVTRQAPLSLGFSRQEYWSGLRLGWDWNDQFHLKLHLVFFGEVMFIHPSNIDVLSVFCPNQISSYMNPMEEWVAEDV